MEIATLRFISLFLTGLGAGAVMTYLIHASAKAALPAVQYLTVQQMLVRGYGRAVAIVEGGAFVSTLALLIVLGSRSPVFLLTLGGLVCISIMGTLSAAFVRPANIIISSWTPKNMPQRWAKVRETLDYLHGMRAAMAFTAFAALIIAAVIDK